MGDVNETRDCGEPFCAGEWGGGGGVGGDCVGDVNETRACGEPFSAGEWRGGRWGVGGDCVGDVNETRACGEPFSAGEWGGGGVGTVWVTSMKPGTVGNPSVLVRGGWGGGECVGDVNETRACGEPFCAGEWGRGEGEG